MGTYGKPNKILFIVLISGRVDFSERTHRYTVIPLYRYTVAPLHRYTVIPLLRYSSKTEVISLLMVNDFQGIDTRGQMT